MKVKFAVFAVLIVAIIGNVEAQRRGGGGGGGSVQRGGGGQVNRSAASTSIRSNQTVSRNANVNRNVNANQNVNRNVDRNADINRDVDVNRDVDFDNDYDRWGHPVARGVTAGLAFGATVAMLPSGCSTVVVNGIAYNQCGSSWYEPYYSGTTVQYVVVAPPQ